MPPDVGQKAKRAAICAALKNLRDATKNKNEYLGAQKSMIAHVHQLMCLMMLNFSGLSISGDNTKKEDSNKEKTKYSVDV